MADQNKVVEFGAAADAGLSYGGAVDAGVGLNFHVVFEDGRARLRHLVPGAIFLFGEAEAVAADDDAVLENHAVADAAVFANDSVGMGEEVIADLNTAIERDETVKHSVRSELDILVHKPIRADVRVRADVGRFRDYGGRMNPGDVCGWLVEEFNGTGEGQIGVAGAQSGQRRQ